MTHLLTNGFIYEQKQNLLIEDGQIKYIGSNFPEANKQTDIEGLHILPGIIDPHTHIRDLKQSGKEDWTSASEAALRSGTTYVFDMPNTRPPTVNREYLNMKREKAKASKINYAFNIAATALNIPQMLEILEAYPKDVRALKLFLAGSNSNEFVDNTEIIKQIFEASLKYDKPVIIHTELQECVENYSAKVKQADVRDHNYMRNRECSIKGTELIIKLASEIGNEIYTAHTSVAEEIDLIAAAKKKGKCRVFCETSPHHLLINESILETAGNFGKVNPPLRTLRDNERIMRGILEGTVDTIGTDHAPHKRSEKLLPFSKAPSGFPGLETSSRLLLNEVNKGNFSLQRYIELSSEKSAEIFKLHRRGKIKQGFWADLAIIDLNKTWTIRAEDFATKAKYSPYEGFTGKGDVVMTFVNGKLLYNNK